MHTFKLNTYESGKIKKTYECKSYDIMFGTLEDLLELSEMGDSAEATVKVMSFIRPLLHDMFPEATSDELRNVRVKDVFAILSNAIAYAVSEMGAGSKKNA